MFVKTGNLRRNFLFCKPDKQSIRTNIQYLWFKTDRKAFFATIYLSPYGTMARIIENNCIKGDETVICNVKSKFQHSFSFLPICIFKLRYPKNRIDIQSTKNSSLLHMTYFTAHMNTSQFVHFWNIKSVRYEYNKKPLFQYFSFERTSLNFHGSHPKRERM